VTRPLFPCSAPLLHCSIQLLGPFFSHPYGPWFFAADLSGQVELLVLWFAFYSHAVTSDHFRRSPPHVQSGLLVVSRCVYYRRVSFGCVFFPLCPFLRWVASARLFGSGFSSGSSSKAKGLAFRNCSLFQFELWGGHITASQTIIFQVPWTFSSVSFPLTYLSILRNFTFRSLVTTIEKTLFVLFSSFPWRHPFLRRSCHLLKL